MVGVGVDPELRVRPLVIATSSAIERELPGLEIRFDLDEWRSFPAPAAGEEPRTDRALVRHGVRLAEADGVDVASYDVVFVLSPLYQGRFFGFSHVAVTTRDGRAARGAAIHSDPRALLLRSARGSLEGAPPPPGFPEEEPSALGRLVRRPLGALLERAEGPIQALLGLPGVREAIIAPTLAHELGHFFAPGDLDIKDGYDTPWMPHATGDGPELNPWGHGVECCMYKGRSLGFYAQKLLAMRGRVVVFCDTCRERLGCTPAASAEGD